MDLHALIKKNRPDIKSNSIDTYVTSLKTLHKLLKGDKNVENLGFLSDEKKVFEVLKKYKGTTQRNFLNAVIVALGPDDKHEVYDDQRDKLNQDYEKEHSDNKKTGKQKENWVAWEKYDKMVDYFGKEVRRLRLRRKDDLSDSEFKLLQDFVLVRFYQDYPLRNDVHDVRVVTERQLKTAPKPHNYLVRGSNQNTLVLRNYKTAKKYGEKRIELNSRLAILIRDYLKVNKTGWLFINDVTEEPLSSNMITKRLQRITKDRLGKRMGSNLIRHSYLSHKYGGVTEEMKEDSNIMGHSLETQQKYIKNSEESE